MRTPEGVWAPWARGDEHNKEKGAGSQRRGPRPVPRPATPRPATGRGQAPATAGTAPSASGSGRVGGAGLAGRVRSRTQAQPGTFRRGTARGGGPRSPGRGRGWRREKEEQLRSPRPLGRSPAPPCGRRRLPPRCARLPASFPPPGALPGTTVPTDGGVKRTYLEPDKQEPLRPGSQSPPGVTGAAPANKRRRRQPLQPIPLRSGLRAP